MHIRLVKTDVLCLGIVRLFRSTSSSLFSVRQQSRLHHFNEASMKINSIEHAVKAVWPPENESLAYFFVILSP